MTVVQEQITAQQVALAVQRPTATTATQDGRVVVVVHVVVTLLQQNKQHTTMLDTHITPVVTTRVALVLVTV
jgi:hypothetical protein